MENATKKFSVESQKRRTMLLPVLAVLFILSGIFQHMIDPDAKQFHAHEKSITALGGLNNEFLLLPLLGFREAAAGLLWVRCDEFFHSGDYDAILPLVRVITWLDPHADNIFVTGAWHLAYNFTDSSERSDRRYIGPAQALLDEGIINNMNIPDIKFEKGWQNYDKIKDFVTAEKALLLALQTPPTKGSDDFPYGAPLKVNHLLAHTYEKQGRLPEALAAWQAALDRSAEMLKKNPKDYSTHQLHSAEQHNHDEALQRYWDRYTSSHHSAVNTTPYPAVLKPTRSNPKPHLWDTSFDPHIEVVRPKVFKVTGAFNAADGARIDVRFTDWNFKERPVAIEQNTFDIDLSQTILVDSIAVRKNKFERELDMSKDPKMYGFNQDFYRMVLQFNTRTTSPHLQDRYGWSGEGITDSNAAHIYVEKNPLLLGTKYIEGQGGTGPVWDGHTTTWPDHGQPPRYIRVTFKISRDQVEGRKPITSADIIPNE
jgi:hypothetical protein